MHLGFIIYHHSGVHSCSTAQLFMGFCTFLKQDTWKWTVGFVQRLSSFFDTHRCLFWAVCKRKIPTGETWLCFRTHSDNCNRLFVFLCMHKGLVSNCFSCCETQVLSLIAFLEVTLSWFKGNLHIEANCKVICNTSYLSLCLFLSDNAESWGCTLITLLTMKSQLLGFNRNDGLQFKTLQNVKAETHKRVCYI